MSEPPNVERKHDEWFDSGSIWVRCGALMLTLAGLKAELLFSLKEYLFQEHWRIQEQIPTWLGPIARLFFFLLMLVGVGLATTRSASLKSRTLRRFVALFSVLWLVFIFVGMSVMKSSYVQILFDGALGWRDIWGYLKLYLFFGPPYFGLYLLGGALLYWILVRFKHEIWIVPLLGTVAITYLWVKWRSPYDNQQDIAIIVCVGLAGLVGFFLSRKPLDWKWQVGTLVPGLLAVVAFGCKGAGNWEFNPCLGVLLIISAALFVLATRFGRGTPVEMSLSYALPCVVIGYFLLASHDYRVAANYNHSFVFGMTSPRYLAQEVVIVLVLAGIAFALRRVSLKAARGFLDCSAPLLIVIGLVDLNLARTMGFRLDWNALVVSNDPVLLWRTIRPQLGPVIIWGSLAIGSYACLVWRGDKFVRTRSEFFTTGTVDKGPIVYATVLVFFMMFGGQFIIKADKASRTPLANILATSPIAGWYEAQHLSREAFVDMAKQLKMGEAARYSAECVRKGAQPKDFNVLLIILESSYNRYLSMFGAEDETQPLLKRYRDRMELFPNFYSNFPSSLNARFSVLSGLYACKPYVTYVNPRINAPSLLDLFRKRNYVVSLFDSSYKDYQRWNDYARFHPIDFSYDAENMPGREKYPKVAWGLNETATMEAIKGQFCRHADRKEKFFLTYIPVMPHMPFDTPSKQFQKFDDGAGQLTHNYTGRFKNQLLFIDWVVAGLLDELERLKLLDNTLVVITDDHGEMVGEDNGQLGHGWIVEPWLCNVPLIIMNPERKGAKLNMVAGSQVDVLPTILDLMQMPVPAGELYQGLSLYSEEAQNERPIFILSQQQRAVIKGSHYYLEDSAEGTTPTTRVYEISHQGAKSFFRLTPEQADVSRELERFESFQQNVILRYPHWKEQLASP